MKKIILLLILLLTSNLVNASVKIGDLYYNLDSSRLTAEVTYLYYDNSNNKDYVSGDLTIPEKVSYDGSEYTVTSIGERAFQWCSGLTSVTIPNSVTEIGSCAFNGCSGLTAVHISSLEAWCNVKFFDSISNPLNNANHLYLNGQEITDLIIPDSVTSIGTLAFFNCRGLTSVTIPNSVTEIGSAAFLDCFGLTAVHISSLEAWCNISFRAYDSNPLGYAHHLYLNGQEIKDLIIPDSVNSIGQYAFYGCSDLTSLTIPNSVTQIGDGAFEYCLGLTSVTIPNSVTSIGSSAFQGCSGLTSVTIPNSVTSIGSDAFRGCSELTSVTIPNYVTYIREGTFYGCSGLTSVTISNSVTEIESYAFNDCTSLKELTFEDGQETITLGYNKYSSGTGIGLFGDCPLEKLYLGRDIDFSLNSSNSNYPWSSYPQRYGYSAFYNQKNLKDVQIGNNVTNIQQYTFYNCSGLTSISIPNSVTSIGESAFYSCSGLTSVTIGNSVTEIGSDAFSGCPITSLSVGNSLTAIETVWFGGSATLENLEEVTIGTGIENIDNSTFAKSANLKKIKTRSLIPPTATGNSFPKNVYSDAVLYVPEQALYIYTINDYWQRFVNILTFNDGISLSNYNVKMAGNQVYQLGVYGSDEPVSWSSANSDLVYVNDNGLIVANGITGSTVVTATVDGTSVDCRVIVNAPYWKPGAENDTIEPASISIEPFASGETMLNVSLTPMNASTVLEWRSSNESLATVQNGKVVVTGTEGEVTLTAVTENGLEASYTFSVVNGEITGIDKVLDDEAVTVYDITGRCLIFNGLPAQFDALPAGIYIVNGKKVVK